MHATALFIIILADIALLQCLLHVTGYDPLGYCHHNNVLGNCTIGDWCCMHALPCTILPLATVADNLFSKLCSGSAQVIDLRA